MSDQKPPRDPKHADDPKRPREPQPPRDAKAPPKWFDGQDSTSQSDPDFERRRARLLEELPKLIDRRHGRSRVDSCYPYLLMRSVLGDRGDRLINTCFWESPDIWTAPGDPSVSPELPPDHGGQVTAGQPHTLYAHVWNLGFAPLAGIHIEFYWFNPSLGITGANANLVGVARCELAARGMKGSHKLVKCPRAWVPVVQNGGHECLVVRVSGIGDPIGANEWQPWLNRHVAQRNISVLSAGANASQLVSLLDVTRPFATRLQLIQIGAREGELARQIAAPRARLAAVDTHVLAELNAVNEVVAPRGDVAPPGALAPVHPFAAGGPPAPPILRAGAAVIDPHVMLSGVDRTIREAGGGAKTRREASTAGAHVAKLFTGVTLLHPNAAVHPRPAADEVHVVRIATYFGEQLVGGYTIVVAGR